MSWQKLRRRKKRESVRLERACGIVYRKNHTPQEWREAFAVLRPVRFAYDRAYRSAKP